MRRATTLLQHSSVRGRLLSEGNFRRLYLRLLADQARSRPQPHPGVLMSVAPLPATPTLESLPVAFGGAGKKRWPASQAPADPGVADPTAQLRTAYQRTLTEYRTRVLVDA